MNANLKLAGKHKFKVTGKHSWNPYVHPDIDRCINVGEIVELNIIRSNPLSLTYLIYYLVGKPGNHLRAILWDHIESEQEIASSPLNCTCDMMLLMRAGCQCGGN